MPHGTNHHKAAYYVVKTIHFVFLYVAAASIR